VVGSAALAVGAGLGGCSDSNGSDGDGGWLPDAKLPAGKVVEVHDPQSISGRTVDAARVKAMLASGLTALAGVSDLKQAWSVLLPGFKPSMRIGLKVNCLSSYVTSSPEIVHALVQTLVSDLGAELGRIVVWDRRGDELANAKLTSASTGATVLGTVKSTTDKSGPGYGSSAIKVAARQTRLTRMVTEETDITINLPVLKKHNVSGVTGALKNVYGLIDNPGEFHDGFNDYLPLIYALQPIPRHFRLVINDALLAVAKGDTTDPPDKIPARMLLSVDPVAMDARVVALINELRGTLPPINTSLLKWLAKCEAAKLGTTRVALQKVAL
jgi:uncharacterized protein (DUF362 family)